MIKESVVSYPDRGPYGDNQYRGNTSGYLIRDLILEFREEGFKIEKVCDPMEGSGTTGDVCKELEIEYIGYDLKSGFDLTTMTPEGPVDFLFLHPPYYKMIKYSDDPKDLSNSPTYPDFLWQMRLCLNNCWKAIRPGGLLALQIGDMRKGGKYYFMAADMAQWRKTQIRNVIIKRQHNVKSSGYHYGKKFIPIKHEYVIVWQKR